MRAQKMKICDTIVRNDACISRLRSIVPRKLRSEADVGIDIRQGRIGIPSSLFGIQFEWPGL